MATDPNIILAAGQINDPYRLAQSQMAQLQLAQAQQAMRGQNALKAVFAQPGAVAPDGSVSPNALAQVMRIDPQTGLDLAKQNRAAMLDQLHIKAAALGNQMSQTKIGKAKWDWMTDIAAATTDSYDEAVRQGASPQMALAKATQTRDQMIRSNGGQMSEQDEQTALSRPLNIDEARAMAGQNKTYLANKKQDQQFGFEQEKEAFAEKEDRARLALDTRRENFEENKPLVVGADSSLVDPNTKQPIFGDGAVQYTGGWTPRERNGGDNSDAAVDNKIAAAAKMLGLGPDDDISKIPPYKIAEAMTANEGEGIARNNNNPAAIKNLKGGYAKFASQQDGLAAATRLVEKKLRNGQTTVRKMIEGLPVRGDSSEENLARGIANYTIAPLTGFALRSARGQRIMAEVEKINPSFDQTAYDEKKRFMSEMGSARPGSAGGATRTLNVAINHLFTLQQLAGAMNNGNVRLVNSIANYWARATGDPAPTNFDGAKVIVGREVAKAITGAGGSVTEALAVEKELSNANSPRQLFGLLQQYRNLFGGQLRGLKQQYEQATGRNDFNRYLSAETLKEIGGQRVGGEQPSRVIRFDAQGNMIQ